MRRHEQYKPDVEVQAGGRQYEDVEKEVERVNNCIRRGERDAVRHLCDSFMLMYTHTHIYSFFARRDKAFV